MLLKKRFSCEQQQLGAILVLGRVLKTGSTTRTAEKVRWRFSCLFVCLLSLSALRVKGPRPYQP